jgi:bacterial/archaeal transporter family-2 protein
MTSAGGSPLAAALVNYGVGLCLYIVALAVVVASGYRLASFPIMWLMMVGPLGVIIVCTIASVVRVLGVFHVTICFICGQIAGALVTDSVAPIRPSTPTMVTVVGSVLTAAGVALAVPRRSGLPGPNA